MFSFCFNDRLNCSTYIHRVVPFVIRFIGACILGTPLIHLQQVALTIIAAPYKCVHVFFFLLESMNSIEMVCFDSMCLHARRDLIALTHICIQIRAVLKCLWSGVHSTFDDFPRLFFLFSHSVVFRFVRSFLLSASLSVSLTHRVIKRYTLVVAIAAFTHCCCCRYYCYCCC